MLGKPGVRLDSSEEHIRESGDFVTEDGRHERDICRELRGQRGGGLQPLCDSPTPSVLHGADVRQLRAWHYPSAVTLLNYDARDLSKAEFDLTPAYLSNGSGGKRSREGVGTTGLPRKTVSRNAFLTVS